MLHDLRERASAGFDRFLALIRRHPGKTILAMLTVMGTLQWAIFQIGPTRDELARAASRKNDRIRAVVKGLDYVRISGPEGTAPTCFAMGFGHTTHFSWTPCDLVAPTIEMTWDDVGWEPVKPGESQ